MKQSQYLTSDDAAEMNRQLAEQINEIEILKESLETEKRTNQNLLNQVSSLELMMQDNFLDTENPKPHCPNPPSDALPDVVPFLDQMGDDDCKKDNGIPFNISKN